MTSPANVIGIDVGSVSIAIVEVSPEREILRTWYDFHHGRIGEAVARILNDIDTHNARIASTASTPSILPVSATYDNKVSIITAAKHFHNSIGSILIIGAEKFGLLLFDENGSYLNYKENTSCAAGTGSFLQQQARRLNLTVQDLGAIAFHNRGERPKIATRCAVFAKTDIIHAQQEGYALEEICDGLCFGLARNLVDTLFSSENVRDPVIFAGGVAKNRAVVQYIRQLTGKRIAVDEHSPLYGALGAAFNLIDDRTIRRASSDIQIIPQRRERIYHHDPLTLQLSHYPEFDSLEHYLFSSVHLSPDNPVEVDIYERVQRHQTYEVYLGIDIGSTSTKAVLMDTRKNVFGGFYTRTAGRPVQATQALFEAIDDVLCRKEIDLVILGSGTTGSGRKLTGKIIGADIIIDEITTHARAATELNPRVDTIIEIGGQDSKFTTLQNGMVNFCVMNTICAAGTGSFIEEQAIKLGCPLEAYSSRAEGNRAPLASDRCTVFMERDLNYYISTGYHQDEILAAVLHSVSENYLTKVAVERYIGNTIFFQGATAKNRALVAAFEQRLEKSILVSKYCHLTGALGTALMLCDEEIAESGFRGLDIHKKEIPIRSEICDLCTNHCKITIAEVEGVQVAYGFLCGRDYDTRKYVNNNRSGFDLFKERRRAFADRSNTPCRDTVTIGIPAALHLLEEIPFWRKFFDLLSIRTITSEDYREALAEGKKLSGAEFCAPLLALHGHVKHLGEHADYVFLPFYLDAPERQRNLRRQYCYYTQFAPSVISSSLHDKSTLLTPLIYYVYSTFHTKVQLYQMLKGIGAKRSSLEVSRAFDRALEFKQQGIDRLRETFTNTFRSDEVSVVLLGRPYCILSPHMNNGIPGIFASMGIKTFFQDMLSSTQDEVRAIEPLLEEFHWEYASRILEAAEVIAGREGLYPVFMTSFRCSPDSFVLDYFKDIMESHEKPYLILQLDEHDSNVGYGTRIEAAVRSFQNHHAAQRRSVPQYAATLIPTSDKLFDKTLILPNWDTISMQLVAANLRREGFDARLLEESETSIQKSLRHNTGQCIPLNIMAQEFIEYIEKYNLSPEKTALWMIASELPCNIKLFPHHIKSILHAHGKGLEKASIYAGSISFMELSLRLPLNTYFAYMFGGLIRKIGCRIRPYEKRAGETKQIIEKSTKLLIDAFLGNRSKEDAVAETISLFKGIATTDGKRPKVAIFGDLYARDNEIMNQNLVRFIEENGGEVITTPYSTYAKMIAGPYLRKWFNEGRYFEVLSSKAILSTVSRLERTYYRYFKEILNEPDDEFNVSPEKILSRYNILLEHTGESMDNILKIFYLLRHYPDIALFVQASPAFCCPSLITEAMARAIERNTGVPVVSITYDAIGGFKNDIIVPYLKYPRSIVPADHFEKMS